MPGTLASDSLAVVLHSAAITSATTTTGTGQYVGWPGDVQVEADPGTMTGTHTCDIEIQGSDVSNFGSGVVKLGRFAQISQAATATQRMNVYCNKKYMRAVIVTAGTVTADNVVVTVRPPHYQRTPDTTA